MPRNSQLTSTASGSTSIRLPRPAPGEVSYYTPQEAAIDNNADLSWTDKKLNKEAMVEKGMVLCKYTRLNLNQGLKPSSDQGYLLTRRVGHLAKNGQSRMYLCVNSFIRQCTMYVGSERTVTFWLDLSKLFFFFHE
jgi:hypothetical protein